jgi:bacterioferritin-associated ferredoxin
MFVCSCRAVTDRCGAGSRCGGCWPELQRLLDLHDAQRAETSQRAVA